MKTTVKPIRTGVVGVGSLGQWHARIYSEMPDVELVGVYDSDRRRAKKLPNAITQKFSNR